jgi:anti-sigma factor RsiW
MFRARAWTNRWKQPRISIRAPGEGDSKTVAKTPTMRCKELVEVITDYLEGTLPAIERARFDAHLTGCGPCRRYLEQMRTTIGALGKLTPETIDPAARARLLSIFREWKQAPPEVT